MAAKRVNPGETNALRISAAINNHAGVLDGSTAIAGHVLFPATQVPSADPNALDDYQEAAFTPSLTFQTPGDLSITYSVQIGTSTKVGRLVTATFSIVSSAFTHTTASGACLISGLPVACAASHHFVGSLIVGGITKATYTQFVVRARDTFPSQLEILASGSGVASSNVAAADMPTGGTLNLRGTIQYEV
jgi:hypothetical protein